MDRYYEMMKYPKEELEQVENEEKGQQVVEQQENAAKSWVDNRMSQNDYVVMKKPDLEPVMYKGKDLNDVVFTILSAVQDVSVVKYFGVNVLLDVLRGVRTKKIDDAKLYEVPEFGALKDISREEIQTIVEWLIAEHFILKTKGNYPVLHPTYDGLHYGDVGTETVVKALERYLKGK